MKPEETVENALAEMFGMGYLVCKRCTRQIFEASQKNPMQQIPLHATIEENLAVAYQRYVGSLPT